jgi:hypothetical protein
MGLQARSFKTNIEVCEFGTGLETRPEFTSYKHIQRPLGTSCALATSQASDRHG